MTYMHIGATRIMGPAACSRVLLVGEDNPLSVEPEYALYMEPNGCAGHRLQSKILGVDARRTYLAMWRTNLCVGGWDEQDAMDRAVELGALYGEPAPWSLIVMLGVKVAKAFRRAGVADVQPFGMVVRDIDRGGHRTFVSLPHPSGRNTVWNDPAKVAGARALLKQVASDVPWGELDQ